MAQKQQQNQEEKKESLTTTIQVSRKLRAVIDELPGETTEEKIRGLMLQKLAVEAPENDKIHLIVDKIAYAKLVTWQPSAALREILVNAKVS